MATAFLYLSDILSNISLTIGCVLLLSQLREVPPDLSINRRLISALFIPASGAVIQRFFAHEIVEVRKILPDGNNALMYIVIKMFGGTSLDLPTSGEMLSLVITIILTAAAAISICAGAFYIMDIKDLRHLFPMLGFQLGGLLFRVIGTIPYKALLNKIVDDNNNELLDISSVYNCFLYGVFMLSFVVLYIYSSQKKYSDLKVWTSTLKKHILSLFSYIVLYSLCICACREEHPAFVYVAMLLISVVFIVIIPWNSYKIMKARIIERQKVKEIQSNATHFRYGKELMKFDHDLPNNLQMIEETALKEGSPLTAELAHSLLEKCITSRKGFITGNSYLDTILSKKKKEADMYGTDIIFEGVFPESGIENIDVGTVMFNALDNAIEACSEADLKREISVISREVGDYVCVKITNPYAKRIKTDKSGRLISTKANDGGIHGIGLMNIEDTVRSYDGTVKKTFDGEIFTLSFKMKYK